MSELHRMAGRIGAHESWARTEDRKARTAPARRAFEARFEKQVDPDNKLSDKERAIRAEHARQAYYHRLALQGVQARARRKKTA